MIRRYPRAAAALVALAIAGGATPVRAEMTKDECIEANTNGQSLRRDGKLSAARAQLQACADAKCPELVRMDCTERLNEVEQAQPSFVFDVKNGEDDVTAVTITMDRVVLTRVLDGTALRVDPGEHTFTFEVQGQKPIQRSFLVKEGDKGRRERIAIAASRAPAPPAVSPADVSPSVGSTVEPGADSGLFTGQRGIGLVAGGVGLAGVVVGGIFGLLASSSLTTQKENCPSPTSCPDREAALAAHDDAITDGTISTIGVVAGGLLLVAGTVLFLTAPGASSRSSARWALPGRFAF